MKFRLQRFLLSIALSVAALTATALDLPVKNIGGELYYYYKVEKKESVYGIAKRLGISQEEIVRHNPDAADGIRKGMTLIFPFDEYADSTPADNGTEVSDAAPEAVTDTAATVSTSSVALLLPLGLDAAEPSRTNELALDFYKGFLIGVNNLDFSTDLVELNVFDTEDGSRSFGELLGDPAVCGADVIIAPSDPSQLSALAANASAGNSYVFNIFSVHDSLYLTCPKVLQANIPQRKMYEHAADAFIEDYEDYIPVILRNRTGKNEKEAFVGYLTERLAAKGIEPRVVEYEGNLVASKLEELKIQPGQKYVAVPTSGSLDDFNKFAYALRSFRERLNRTGSETDGEDTLPEQDTCFELFGYPDWTAFRGDALELLHSLGATIYSRFFNDFNSEKIVNFDNDFRYWYGDGFIESIPCQSLLGHDTAAFIIGNLRANGGVFNPDSQSVFKGIQSDFRFEKSGEGYCNDVLFIISYLSSGEVTSRTL